MGALAQKVKQYLHRRKYRKTCAVSAKATVDGTCRFAGKNRICADVTFLHSFMGYASYVGERSFIRNTSIGKYSCLGPEVLTASGTHPTEFVSIHPAFYSTKKQSGFTFAQEDSFAEYQYIDPEKKISVTVGNDVWIGTRATLLEHISIGDGAIVAAGSVVTKDVPPYAIVGGVPAKIIRYRFSPEEIEKLLKIKWWNKDEAWLKAHAKEFSSVREFLANNTFA